MSKMKMASLKQFWAFTLLEHVQPPIDQMELGHRPFLIYEAVLKADDDIKKHVISELLDSGLTLTVYDMAFLLIGSVTPNAIAYYEALHQALADSDNELDEHTHLHLSMHSGGSVPFTYSNLLDVIDTYHNPKNDDLHPVDMSTTYAYLMYKPN